MIHRIFILVCFFITFSVHAKNFSTVPTKEVSLTSKDELVIQVLAEDLGIPGILEPTTPTQVVDKEVTPKDDSKPKKKELGRGASYVQQQLAKNRQKLGGVPSGGGKAYIEKMKQINRQMIETHAREDNIDEDDLKGQYLKNLAKLKQQNRSTLLSWKDRIQRTKAEWEEKRAAYLNRVNDYKNAAVAFEDIADIPPLTIEELRKRVQEIEANNTKEVIKSDTKSVTSNSSFHVIPGALALEIGDQGKRPTCAAFAGVRAIETLLAQNGKTENLSEQYFYWASKPNCQKGPCSKRGSWVLPGFRHSQKAISPDIPRENSCDYSSQPKAGNETHLPLNSSCSQGFVQVTKFSEVKTLADIRRSLKGNRPVIGGFYLSPNFYQARSLVSFKDSKVEGKTDAHAAGHALLLVGEMELPKDLHRDEGKFCLIVANSWGEGWGRGGFSCLSQKWIEAYRIQYPFVALESVRTI